MTDSLPSSGTDAGMEPKDRPASRISPVIRIQKHRDHQRHSRFALPVPVAPPAAAPDQVPAVASLVPEQPAPAATPRNWRLLTVQVEGNPKAAPALWVYFTRLKAAKKANPDNLQVKQRWKEVRDFLFSLYWDDADKIVRAYLGRNMPRYSLLEADDLKQGIARGLLGCIDTYDITVGTDFLQYANAKRSRLRGAVIDALRELQDFPRLTARERRELRPLFAKLAQKLRKQPSIEEFLEHYGTKSPDGKFDYQKILTDPLYWSGVFNQARQGSASGDDGGVDPDEVSREAEDTRPKGLCGLQRSDSITQILSVIQDRKANFAVWAYYWAGMTNDQISKHLGCSPSVAAAKHKEGLAILKQHFTAEQFRSFIQAQDE